MRKPAPALLVLKRKLLSLQPLDTAAVLLHYVD